MLKKCCCHSLIRNVRLGRVWYCGNSFDQRFWPDHEVSTVWRLLNVNILPYLTSCRCPLGFTGPYCEVDVDYCVGHKCSEHGICLDQEQNYTCRCQPGYEGSYCERRVNQCRSSPCVNGASCIETAHGYQCLCAPGFEGRLGWLGRASISSFISRVYSSSFLDSAFLVYLCMLCSPR